MGELQTDDDFRSALEVAVAYRLTEMYGVPVLVARKRVRDFAKYGVLAEHGDQVLAAGYDLFKPFLGGLVPVLRTFLQAAISGIQAQIQRGAEVARANDPDDK